MANTCILISGGVSGELSSKYSDESVEEQFYITLDTGTRNIVAVANAARAASPSIFPVKGQSWPVNPGYGLFAKRFSFKQADQLLKKWRCTVTYLPLEPNEPNTDGVNDNPLLWPPVYGLEWIEEEVAVTKGRNVQQIGSATTTGVREALTLGEIVNGALAEFAEGLYRTRRTPVITITDNVASLNDIYSTQTSYEDTTNSDSVGAIGPRRLEFLCVEHHGEQTANSIPYYSRTSKVALKKTTERRVQNVGWKYWRTGLSGQEEAPFKVTDEDTGEKVLASEPGFLLASGAKSTIGPTALDYRILEEVAYGSLMNP